MLETLDRLEAVRYLNGEILQVGKTISGGYSSSQYATNYQHGFRDPAYQDKIRLLQDASQPYTAGYFKLKQPYLVNDAIRTSGLNRTYEKVARYTKGNFTPPSTIPVRTATDDIALKRLKRKLANDVEGFKSLIPLGEIKETRRLLRSTADVTSELLKSLIELRRGRPRNVLSKASKAWLQFSFAISPTISDLNSAVNSVGAYLLRDNFAKTYKGSADERWFERVGITEKVTTNLVGGYWNQRPQELTHHYKVRYTAGVRFRLRSANNYGLDDHFGLTFGDLPSLFWELTPFSWVVDYFTTTGAFLEDVFENAAGNTFYCTKSMKYELLAEADLDWVEQDFYSEYQPGSSTRNAYLSAESTLFQRVVLPNIPHRVFRLKTVDEIGINRVNKVLNLASILFAK